MIMRTKYRSSVKFQQIICDSKSYR